MILPAVAVRRWLVWALLVTAAAPRAGAQNALCVEDNGKPSVVRRIAHGFAYIERDGKLVAVKPQRYALAPVPEFYPAFVSVRDLEVKTSHLEVIGGAPNGLNHEFHLTATFESAYQLKDPFLVLELATGEVGKRIFFQEIGPVGPGKPSWVRVVVALPDALGKSKFKLHVFSGGREVFHSNQPRQFRDRAVDKMILQRIAGVKDAPPQPLLGPPPEYPQALFKSRVSGEAVVVMRLSHTGEVLEPKVERATDPAFGESALVAVRQWRFLPQVRDGHPVETAAARMPFSFEPPAVEKN